MAPLTLLVGENSTGKTSLLALIRALTDLAHHSKIPNFKEDPYDLGSYDEIAHVRDGRGGRAKTFKAGFTFRTNHKKAALTNFDFTFRDIGTAPVPIRRQLFRGKTWIDESYSTDRRSTMKVGTSRGIWEVNLPGRTDRPIVVRGDSLHPYSLIFLMDAVREDERFGVTVKPIQNSLPISEEDYKQLATLADCQLGIGQPRAFASAPVRSKPRRTYDPARPSQDSEGDYVPMLLADMFSRDTRAWTKLKSSLERFGSLSGLFDEISIRRLGKRESEPFQVQIRKFRGRRKGPQHNLIDVGYGVSQALPVITELLGDNKTELFLLQQPEVHLHPRAQAALGSLFCEVAEPDRQLVVETHSDYLLDRVRMEVRDGTAGLKPEDVSILFFERVGLDVKIHSLRIGKQGNIEGAPNAYRQFFMEETTKSLGL